MAMQGSSGIWLGCEKAMGKRKKGKGERGRGKGKAAR